MEKINGAFIFGSSHFATLLKIKYNFDESFTKQICQTFSGCSSLNVINCCFLFVLYHIKCNIFGFWTVDQTKQGIWGRHPVLWGIVEICNSFLTFETLHNSSINHKNQQINWLWKQSLAAAPISYDNMKPVKYDALLLIYAELSSSTKTCRTIYVFEA